MPFLDKKLHFPKLISRNELRVTVIFFAVGVLVTFLLFEFLLSDVHYSSAKGTTYRITMDGIVFGGSGTLFMGWLLPLVCFWFKFIRWHLAWIMMACLSVSAAFAIRHYEKRPEALIQRYLGKYSGIVHVDEMIEYNRYESSGVYFGLGGNTSTLDDALKKTFTASGTHSKTAQGNEIEYFNGVGVRQWSGPNGEYCFFIQTWEGGVFEKWKAFVNADSPR